MLSHRIRTSKIMLLVLLVSSPLLLMNAHRGGFVFARRVVSRRFRCRCRRRRRRRYGRRCGRHMMLMLVVVVLVLVFATRSTSYGRQLTGVIVHSHRRGQCVVSPVSCDGTPPSSSSSSTSSSLSSTLSNYRRHIVDTRRTIRTLAGHSAATLSNINDGIALELFAH